MLGVAYLERHQIYGGVYVLFVYTPQDTTAVLTTHMYRKHYKEDMLFR